MYSKTRWVPLVLVFFYTSLWYNIHKRYLNTYINCSLFLWYLNWDHKLSRHAVIYSWHEHYTRQGSDISSTNLLLNKTHTLQTYTTLTIRKFSLHILPFWRLNASTGRWWRAVLTFEFFLHCDFTNNKKTLLCHSSIPCLRRYFVVSD